MERLHEHAVLDERKVVALGAKEPHESRADRHGVLHTSDLDERYPCGLVAQQNLPRSASKRCGLYLHQRTHAASGTSGQGECCALVALTKRGKS